MSAPASAPTFDRSAIVAALKEMRLQIEAIEWSLGGVQYLPPCEPAPEPKAAPEPASASEASAGDAPKKERKKREPMSEEKKAAMKAKREATIAAKAAKTWSLSELRDFTTIIIDGVKHGVNLRGDAMNEAHEFVGNYNEKTKKFNRTAPKPADWDVIIKDEDEDEDEEDE